MGCSSSREALGGAPAERRTQGLRSRSLPAVLTSLGMYRRGNGGVLHAYAKLPSAGDAAAKGSAAPKGPFVSEKALSITGEHAASATSSSWLAPSLLPVRAAAPDLASAVLPGLRQIMEDYPLPSSHPSLLYPEHDHPMPAPETTTAVEETTCDVDEVVDAGTPAARDIPEVVATGIVRTRVDEFHQQMEKKKKDKVTSTPAAPDGEDVATPRDQPAVDVDLSTLRSNKVVVYFTSLRGVRRTFEDGRAVRAILRCYRVRVDERDVSIHAGFKAELRDLLLLLLGGGGGGPLALPRVFLVRDHDGGRQLSDLGGAEELRALHEAGELARALAGCEAGGAACAACGDARFAVCEACCGSCKVFVGGEGCRIAGGFQECPYCNENGLIRCPVCCY